MSVKDEAIADAVKLSHPMGGYPAIYEAIRLAREDSADTVPTNWCHPILAGPDAVDLTRCDGGQIVALLQRVATTIRERGKP